MSDDSDRFSKVKDIVFDKNIGLPSFVLDDGTLWVPMIMFMDVGIAKWQQAGKVDDRNENKTAT